MQLYSLRIPITDISSVPSSREATSARSCDHFLRRAAAPTITIIAVIARIIETTISRIRTRIRETKEGI